METHPDYHKALQHELNNRALAGQVVPALANIFSGSPRGQFWEAYADLERQQWPWYVQHTNCHNIQAQRLLPWIKAKSSIPFARLFPDYFTRTLASSTQAYLQILETVQPPKTVAEQQFWHYVIAQEKAQVDALQKAANGDFIAAQTILRQFQDTLEPPNKRNDCVD